MSDAAGFLTRDTRKGRGVVLRVHELLGRVTHVDLAYRTVSSYLKCPSTDNSSFISFLHVHGASAVHCDQRN
jgi:hypothetical protein